MKNSRNYKLPFIILFCVLTLVSAQARNQKPVSTIDLLPFEPAEELVYESKYSRSILRGISIAELRFTAQRTPQTLPAKTGGSEQLPRLQFTAEAISKGIFTKLFGLRFHQRIESTVEPGSFNPLRTIRLDEQGNRRRSSETVFDRVARRLTWTERDLNDSSRAPRTLTTPLDSFVQDIASVFYYLRTQPLEPGKSLEIPIADSGRIYRVRVRIVEKARLSTVLGEVPVVRVDPELFGDKSLIAGKGSISIWLTDDARHIPVSANISTPRGTLDIKLKSITRSPLTKAIN